MGEVEERHKQVLARFWEEVWDKGDLDVVDEIFHPEFVDHGLAPGLSKQGPEGAKEAVMQFRTAMPDLYLKCNMMIAEGDKVLSLWESGGTQTGPLKNAQGTIPPTGNRGIAAPRRTNPGARLTYIYAPVVHAVARIPRAGELRPLRNITHLAGPCAPTRHVLP